MIEHPSFKERTELYATARRGADAIFGTGEMADRTRSFDWGRTPVGPIDQWPEVLRTTVNTLLCSRHPMFLWWGEDLIQFYNDAYRPSIREDKHPNALGQRGEECWPEIWPIIGPQIDDVMTSGTGTWNEEQLVPILRNGKLEDIYWTYSYSPVHGSDGTICGTLVVCTEVTEVVKARQQLHREKERLAELFEKAPAFFAVLSGPEHVFEMVNEKYRELVGRSVVGKTVREAIPEAEAQGFVALLDGVYQTGHPFVGRDTPLELVTEGSEKPELHYLDFVYQPRFSPDGAVTGILAFGVDMTEGKRTQQVLLQSEKLAAVGQLASTIAHEINNPLEAITNLIYLAKDTSELSDARRYLDMAEQELRRVSVISSQTLRFHKQLTRPTLASCDDLLAGCLSIYQGRIINAGIFVEERKRAFRPVLSYEGEIRQILNNLIGNAIDAMRGGGRLILRSSEATDWRTGRKGVRLTIADTGVGMSQGTLKQIFHPFFTTKGIGGTGLGLWVSHEIAERHRGRLSVRSTQRPERHGTVFALFLPFEAASR